MVGRHAKKLITPKGLAEAIIQIKPDIEDFDEFAESEVCRSFKKPQSIWREVSRVIHKCIDERTKMKHGRRYYSTFHRKTEMVKVEYLKLQASAMVVPEPEEHEEDVTVREHTNQEEIALQCRSQNEEPIDFGRPDIPEESIMLMNEQPSTDINHGSNQVLEFLKTSEKSVDRLLQDLEISAITDLLLKLRTDFEGNDMQHTVLNWWNSQELVQRLIKLLSPTSEPARHANAAQFLCGMIKLRRDFRIRCTEHTEPDPILNTLESEETVSLLLETILSDEPIESSIAGGIQVLLVLLGHETNNIANEGDVQGNRAGNNTTDVEVRIMIQNATLPYLDILRKLLINSPFKPPATAELLENTRRHCGELLVALMYTENMEMFRRLTQLGTFQTLLELFFMYSCDNVFHTQVEQCLAALISDVWQENSETVYSHIFVECNLINRVLEAWTENKDRQNGWACVQEEYMGPLMNIVKNIVKECEKNQVLDAYLKNNLNPQCAKQWEKLVTTELVKTDARG